MKKVEENDSTSGKIEKVSRMLRTKLVRVDIKYYRRYSSKTRVADL